MAAAYYLARLGVQTTIYEKRDRLGGIVSAVIPDFRIDDSQIAKDAALLKQLGVEVLCGKEAPPVAELTQSYDAVILAVGAYKLTAGQNGICLRMNTSCCLHWRMVWSLRSC